MEFFQARMSNLQKLYVDQLRMLRSTEQQVITALEDLEERASDVRLQRALRTHCDESQTHAARLRQILEELQEKDYAVISPLTDGLVTAALGAGAIADPEVRDAAIIAAVQQIEHFEICAYGTVRSWAAVLGYPDHSVLLDQTLQEESHADKRLTSVARFANPQARLVA